jgi:hypothetical protein
MLRLVVAQRLDLGDRDPQSVLGKSGCNEADLHFERRTFRSGSRLGDRCQQIDQRESQNACKTVEQIQRWQAQSALYVGDRLDRPPNLFREVSLG